MDLTVTPTETPPKALGVMAHTASSNLKIEPHHMRNSLQVNKFPLAIPAINIKRRYIGNQKETESAGNSQV